MLVTIGTYSNELCTYSTRRVYRTPDDIILETYDGDGRVYNVQAIGFCTIHLKTMNEGDEIVNAIAEPPTPWWAFWRK